MQAQTHHELILHPTANDYGPLAGPAQHIAQQPPAYSAGPGPNDRQPLLNADPLLPLKKLLISSQACIPKQTVVFDDRHLLSNRGHLCACKYSSHFKAKVGVSMTDTC
eukprot:TRINITY_DN10916_c0_g1_i2.p1 TRINITY_DN10916_c0_g1~~TRINITY_DN10916_c0_g1_i2.p1  ORF type:complete len:108 (+),score=22.36 TRINITY_DN10916_c0_g1_i2:329-652(+)